MAFRGKRVMLSPNLVPPEMFDMLHGTLKENGAEVCLCCNPSYNSSNDFHVLPSCDSEKFAELQSRGCNVVGPECILRCAKEGRPFPSVKYTCCLSLDKIRILSTGFEGSEKVRIQQLVTAMCGELVIKASMDVDFVVAKDVLTPKYKWASFTLRKPILSIDWLVQCFRDHRRVHHEPYRLPIFTGVIVCTTGVLMEERKKIAGLVAENGGCLRADLTKECTHLIAKSADGDKFKVANMQWRHIKCVNEEWFWNSLSEKVCLEESCFAVRDVRMSCGPQVYDAIPGPPPTPDKFSQDLNVNAFVPGTGAVGTVCVTQEDAQGPIVVPAISGAGQMYLSDCRFYLTGFESVEMRKLVNMVLDGGGTRYMEFNERITHVILGKFPESDLKDIRQYAMWGTVHIVLPTWLEECSRQRREVAVSAQFVVSQTVLSQNFHSKLGRSKSAPVNEKKSPGESMHGQALQRKLLEMSQTQPDVRTDFIVSQDSNVHRQPLRTLASNPVNCPKQGAGLKKHVSLGVVPPVEQVIVTEQQHPRSHSMLSSDTDAHQPLVSDPCDDSRPASLQKLRKQVADSFYPKEEAGYRVQEPMKPLGTSNAGAQEMRYAPNTTTGSSNLIFEAEKRVFEGRVFGFTPSFETCTRAEIIQWVVEGGGRMLGDVGNGDFQEAEFLIYPHGPRKDPCTKCNIKCITSHWIKYCLQEGTLLDINSHILFQPLCCQVPLPGFEGFRFALTQYGDRERILLYNLCHALGAKYQEKKMNKRATHLLCKVGDGEKYEAALLWGIEIVTAEWLYACVAKNMVVHPDLYRPKRLTVADKEAGLGIPTQNPAVSFPCDVGVSLPDRCSKQNDAEISVGPQVNHSEELETKGKTMKVKQKSNLRGRARSAGLEVQVQALQGNRASTNCSLTSQMAGGNLDPWDELTASWANEDAPRGVSTRSQHKAVKSIRVLSNMPVNLEPSRIQGELSDDLKQDDKNAERQQPSTTCTPGLVSGERRGSVELGGFESEEDESETDVASAIEGLLAQTRKVQFEDASRSPDADRDLLSPDSIKLNRRNSKDLHEQPSFKRPKIVSSRSMDSGGEQVVQSVTPSEESFEKFEESQWDSQVVAYDEDSEKQRIMERVRTRSMSLRSTSGSEATVQHREKISWKGIEFNRLLQAADRNK